MTRYEEAPEGFKRVYIRAQKVKDEKALQKALESKHKILYYFVEKVD